MNIQEVSFDKIKALSYKDTFYQLNPEKLKDFLSYMPDETGLDAAIKQRKKIEVDRDLLVNVLSNHYEGKIASEKQYQNIFRLRDKNTFTVITAHQPSILGGPAYYFYKICSVIHLTEHLIGRASCRERV